MRDEHSRVSVKPRVQIEKPTHTRFFYGWVIVAVAALLGFLGTGFYSYSRGIFLTELADELANGSRFWIAAGFSAASITGAIVAPFIGHLLDRFSPRIVILTGVCVVATSYVLLASTANLWQYFLVVGIGMGFGMTCMGGLAWHRTVVSWFDHWRGRAIALAVMGASIAGVMMPPLVEALLESIGWRLSYAVFAAVTFFALVPAVWLYMKDRPSDIDEVRDGHKYVDSNPEEQIRIDEDTREWRWQDMLTARPFWAIGLVFGAMGCVYSATMLHLFGHLTDIGVTRSYAAWVLSATALFAALGKPIVGWLADAVGARVTIWLALVCQGGALILFAQADSLSLAFAAGCLYGFGYSGMSPLRTFALSTAMGSVSFGAANGIIRFVELPLVLMASPLAGFIYDVTGSYRLAFLILAGLMGLALLGPLFMPAGGARERHRRK